MSAKQHGQPGEWAKVRGTFLSFLPLFLCFTALGAFGAAIALGRQQVLFAALFCATVVATALFWRKGVRRVESYFKGARGEERVAGLLSALPDGWHVFHDYVAEGVHVDHVAVGPGGVFAVETKNWRGTVTDEGGEIFVDGFRPDRPPLPQAVGQADAVKRECVRRNGSSVPVTPVLCFASDAYAPAFKTLGAVAVLNAERLAAWLAAQPVVFAPNEVQRLAQLMETTR